MNIPSTHPLARRMGGCRAGLGVVNTETMSLSLIEPQSSRPVFRKISSSVAHPNLSKTHDGTPQNFASRKEVTKLYVAINMYLHIGPCPIRMQAYENKTKHVLNETIDDEPVCVCVCVYEF
jgi:hypothetical protein